MEYTASGFSEPILTIFRPIYRTEKKVVREFHDVGRSIFKEGNAEIHTFKFFEERIYLPVAHFTQRLSSIVRTCMMWIWIHTFCILLPRLSFLLSS